MTDIEQFRADNSAWRAFFDEIKAGGAGPRIADRVTELTAASQQLRPNLSAHPDTVEEMANEIEKLRTELAHEINDHRTASVLLSSAEAAKVRGIIEIVRLDPVYSANAELVRQANDDDMTLSMIAMEFAMERARFAARPEQAPGVVEITDTDKNLAKFTMELFDGWRARLRKPTVSPAEA